MHTRRAAILLLAMIPLLAPSAVFASDDPPAPSIIVATFNIRYDNPGDGANAWPNRRDTARRVIASFNADILCLQEVLHNQLDDLLKRLPEFTSLGSARDDGKTRGEYSPILFRTDRFEPLEHGQLWLSDTPEVPGSRSWGNSIPRILTWARLRHTPSGRALYVFNTHLDHSSQPSRMHSAAFIANRINSRPHPDPVILAGDFNAGEANPAISLLTGRGPETPADATSPTPSETPDPAGPRLRCVFRDRNPAEAAVGTYHAFTGRNSGEMIDYIFVCQGFMALSARIDRTHEDGRFPSDHFAVVAELTFARPDATP